MEIFFIVIDYSIPILMIMSYPWWKKVANGGINKYSGFRTAKSMENIENWKKANLLSGKYCIRLGVGLLLFVIVMRYAKLFPMEWNSLLISTINIISIILMTIYVNKKI